MSTICSRMKSLCDWVGPFVGVVETVWLWVGPFVVCGRDCMAMGEALHYVWLGFSLKHMSLVLVFCEPVQ